MTSDQSSSLFTGILADLNVNAARSDVTLQKLVDMLYEKEDASISPAAKNRYADSRRVLRQIAASVSLPLSSSVPAVIKELKKITSIS